MSKLEDTSEVNPDCGAPQENRNLTVNSFIKRWIPNPIGLIEGFSLKIFRYFNCHELDASEITVLLDYVLVRLIAFRSMRYRIIQANRIPVRIMLHVFTTAFPLPVKHDVLLNQRTIELIFGTIEIPFQFWYVSSSYLSIKKSELGV